MIVSAKEMLNTALKENYAIGQFNIMNMEWIKTILSVAKECKSPVILGVSTNASKYMCGYKTVVNMVNNMIEYLNIDVPVALHLDHGSYEAVTECIYAGFSSVMFDGSLLSIQENIKMTSELIGMCKKKGISIEAEVGTIGGEKEGVIKSGEYAEPFECHRMAQLDINMLAAGIGNIHGVYPPDWKGLNFETLKRIKSEVGMMPLVLHGGTGIPDYMIEKAISLGIAKINVNTECQIAFAEGLRNYFKAEYDKIEKGYDPRKLLQFGFDAMAVVIKEKMKLFGSINRAK